MRILTINLTSLFVMTLFGCTWLYNQPPVIKRIDVSKTEVKPGEEVIINVIATDAEGDELTYEYQINGGERKKGTWKTIQKETQSVPLI